MSRLFKRFGFHLSWSLIFVCLIVCSFSTTVAQKVRLRAQINPNCETQGGLEGLKYADIYADGNMAVQGSYNCRGVFIYDLTNPDAPVLASVYNPAPTQAFLEAIVIGNRGYFGSGGPFARPAPQRGEGWHLFYFT